MIKNIKFTKLSVDRNEFVALKLGNLSNKSLLDLGCRDMILSKYLVGIKEYKGLDFITPKKNKKLIFCDLDKRFPIKLKKFDIITAIDVLEHLENIHRVVKQMFKKSKKIVVIALPNMSYYKFRLKFLFIHKKFYRKNK